MIKYLFSDVDGTLMKDKTGEIDKKTIEKIQNFIKNGNKFYMATGRTDADIRFLEEKMNIKCDYRISQNGTIVTDKNNNIIFESSIPKDILFELKDYLYGLKNIRIEASEPIKRYATSIRPPEYHPELAIKLTIDENLKDNIGLSVFPSLFLILQESEEDFDNIKEYIHSKYPEKLVALCTSHGILEIINKNSSKGNAINFLVEKEKFNRENIFVVGDNDNDVSMLSIFKNSFAMKESKYEVMRHANFAVNVVGDVISYIENPENSFNITNKILVKLKNSLIVSCQADPHEAMYDKSGDTMAKMAVAAKEGGAMGVKSNYLKDIIAMKKAMDLPIMGVVEVKYSDSEITVTPSTHEVKELIEAGVEIINLDASLRVRPNNESIQSLVLLARQLNPKILLMADVSNVEEAINAEKLGFDLISTALVGYTQNTKGCTILDDNFKILKDILSSVGTPVVAEGSIMNPEEAEKCLVLGCHSVVVGSAISRPARITKMFVEGISAKIDPIVKVF